MTPLLTDTILILTGGGASSRFGGGARGKLFAPLAGLPVFAHALRTLAPLFPENRIVMTVPAALREIFRAETARLFPALSVRFVPGGATRAESVRHALDSCAASGIRYVAVHDAARPLISRADFLRCLEVCRKTGAAMLARRMTDTVKRSAPGTAILLETVARENLWAAETPQIFLYEELREAYGKLKEGEGVTDDAQVWERYGRGGGTEAVEPQGLNMKITYERDIRICELLLKQGTGSEEHV